MNDLLMRQQALLVTTNSVAVARAQGGVCVEGIYPSINKQGPKFDGNCLSDRSFNSWLKSCRRLSEPS